MENAFVGNGLLSALNNVTALRVVALAFSFLFVSGCTQLLTPQPGSIASMTWEENALERIEVLKRKIKSCETTGEYPSGPLKECNMDAIACQKLYVEVFESASGTIRERVYKARPVERKCLNENVYPNTGGRK